MLVEMSGLIKIMIAAIESHQKKIVFLACRLRSSMDRISDSGSADVGSTPAAGTENKNKKG